MPFRGKKEKSGMPLFAQPKSGMPLGLKLSIIFSGGLMPYSSLLIVSTPHIATLPNRTFL
jgi:hypothetical protein